MTEKERWILRPLLPEILAIIASQVHKFLPRQLYRLVVEVWSSDFSARTHLIGFKSHFHLHKIVVRWN